MKRKAVTSRHFVGAFAAGATTISIVPSRVLGGPKHIAPSDKLNIAGIGVGGMGRNYLYNALSENIVALCDADEERYENVYKKFSQNDSSVHRSL